MTILDTILAHKRNEVASARAQVPPAEMARRAASARPRDFRAALIGSPHHPALIAEVKAASPSQGPIRPDLDPVSVAQAYAGAGADCLSVLTDARFFGGSAENLIGIRDAVELPILRKDFIFDEYQLDEALAWGADAILLIVAMLPPEEIARLLVASHERGLAALVEVHSEEEAAVAEAIGADFIGINNRDLSTFRTDLGTTGRLIAHISAAKLVISESALATREDVEAVTRAGVRGVLIGTAFCAEPDVAGAVRRIMPWGAAA